MKEGTGDGEDWIMHGLRQMTEEEQEAYFSYANCDFCGQGCAVLPYRISYTDECGRWFTRRFDRVNCRTTFIEGLPDFIQKRLAYLLVREKV